MRFYPDFLFPGDSSQRQACQKYTVRNALTLAKEYLAGKEVDSPALSAELLLASCMSITRAELLKRLILTPGSTLATEMLQDFRTLVERRGTGEPAAYLLGHKEFYGREFHVTSDTLIPRPDTELLVETALELFAATPEQCTFADLGTGSGCIAITLICELETSFGIAIDNSLAALKIARKNAADLHIAAVTMQRLAFIHADFMYPPLARETYSLIVSNPPYISGAEFSSLDKEVACFEPKSALVPLCFSRTSAKEETATSDYVENLESTGLEHIEKIIEIAHAALQKKGWLLIEIGHTQGKEAQTLAHSLGWKEVSVRQDLAGKDRLLCCRKI